VPQPRSGGSKPRSSTKTTSGRAQPKRSTAGSSAGAARATRSSATKGRGSGSSSTARSTKTRASASPEARLEAAAERLRKLNERIIEAGKQAGETTLSSYEKALKAIASTVERGPGSSEIDWISHLATTQAKFIRDVTEAWTSAARHMLKK
jgi:hypothetical protein